MQPAGIDQPHRDEHHHAHDEHDVGHLKGGKTLGGVVADAVVQRIAEHGQHQKQHTQRGDHHGAAHGDQRHAADGAQRAQHLLQRHPLVEHQHIHEDAAHRHGSDDGTRHRRGGVQNTVVLENKIRHRLHDAQQHQLIHRLAPQGKGEQRPPPELTHQRID